jgi:transposase
MKKVMRCERFRAKIEQVVPWAALPEELRPHDYPKAGQEPGRPPIALERMLRMYFLQQWFTLADEALEDAIYDNQAFRNFLRIDLSRETVPDATTLCGFRYWLEDGELGKALFERINAEMTARGLLLHKDKVLDATIIAPPPSTKNRPRRVTPRCTRRERATSGTSAVKRTSVPTCTVARCTRSRWPPPTRLTSRKPSTCCIVRSSRCMQTPATPARTSARRALSAT